MINIEPVADIDTMPCDWDSTSFCNDATWQVWYQHNKHSAAVLKFSGDKQSAIAYYDALIEAWG